VASNVDSVIGTTGADTIVLQGASSDTVWAGAGADRITASTGVDHFLYKAQGDSGLGVSADTITGFNAGNAASTVDQLYLLGLVQGTMHFAGNAAFSSHLGTTEVRAISGTAYGSGLTTNDAVIQIDVDGNGTADMEIKLLGTNVANIDQGDIFGG
jgi:Ca2+-binding RTX toxin-like protein